MLEKRLQESESKLRLSSARHKQAVKDKELETPQQPNDIMEADNNAPLPTDAPLATEVSERGLLIDDE